MSVAGFGHCDHCGAALAARHWCFDRNVERVCFAEAGGEMLVTIEVIHAETWQTYCSEACAIPAVQQGMADRGFVHLYPGAGPTEWCALCSKPIDMTDAHVAYNLLVGIETRKPWLTEYAPDTDEAIAVVCLNCEPALVMEATAEDEVMGSDRWPCPVMCLPDKVPG